MKRRNFLKSAGTLSLPIFIGGVNVRAIASSPLFNMLNGDSDRVLVLIQLNGGNDGLNTIIPLDQYDNLVNARPNVIVPDSSVLEIDLNNGLHPNMTGIKSMYDDAKVSIVQSVGYPNQNRSHFRSTDIWMSGSSAEDYVSSGWIGRYLQDQFPTYPDGYPNADCPDPMAITMGPLVTETCQGLVTNFSLAINDLDAVATVNEVGGVDVPDNCYGEELVFVRQAIAQTNAYAESLINAADNGSTLSNKYPADNRLAQQLKQVARMISGGLQTKIYVVQLGGFDTHAAQVVDGDTTIGAHANLLQIVSDAVCAFHDDMKLLGLEKRVLSMTFSEFGRQIKSNFSLGTDHGSAAPLMLFGNCVKPGIVGTNPEISGNVQVQEGVPMQYDFRSVYGTVLMDWLNVPEDKVKDLLFDDFQHLPLIDGCEPTAIDDVDFEEELQMRVYPNPFSSHFNLQFHSKGGHYQLHLFDGLGHRVKEIGNTDYYEGQHNIQVHTSNMAPGNYFLRIANRHNQKTIVVQKVN